MAAIRCEEGMVEEDERRHISTIFVLDEEGVVFDGECECCFVCWFGRESTKREYILIMTVFAL